MARGANQLDIARAAGVSVSTVSRALSNSRGISAELRETIHRLAGELGYEPRGGRAEHRPVRAYVTMNAVSSSDAGFYQVLLDNLKQAAEAAAIDLELTLVQARDLTAERIAADLSLSRPAATLLVGIDPTEEVAALYGPERPLVLVNALDPAMRFDCVAANNFYGALLATRALLAAGHRDLLYLHDHQRWTTRRRQGGFTAAIEEVPGAIGSSILAGSDDAIRAAVAARKAGHTAWTAVCCMCDQVAIPLVEALAAAGLRVPDDISVIGFDDLAPASMLSPGLSTMHIDFAALAREAIALLLRRLAEPDAAIVQVECAVTPVLRDTIAQIA